MNRLILSAPIKNGVKLVVEEELNPPHPAGAVVETCQMFPLIYGHTWKFPNAPLSPSVFRSVLGDFHHLDRIQISHIRVVSE